MKKLSSLLLLGATSFAAHASDKPNLLVIHTDEHSFRTLSCYQELLPEDEAFVWGKGVNSTTPNIDRLAHEGAIYTEYYCSSAVSTPSRASFITGQFPTKTGAPQNGLNLHRDMPTFGSILRDNGYSTSYLGKWHLSGNQLYEFGIEYNGGFDDNQYMMTGGAQPYFFVKPDGSFETIRYQDKDQYADKELIHYTDFFLEHTLEILERDKDKPFCLMLSIPDPHTPDYARPPFHNMYDHLNPQEPYTMTPEVAALRPKWAAGTDKNEAGKFDPEALRQYFGMVSHIDYAVGEILDYLDENGLSENTIVVFTADHGDLFFEHKRRNKGRPYATSAKIPFVIRYPKKIEAGKVIREAAVNPDFVPTILSLMDVKSDAKFDGTDISKDLESSKMTVDGERMVLFSISNGGWSAAATTRYKYVLSVKDEPWLFDLERDPHEIVNCCNDPKYKKIVEKMEKFLISELNRVGEPGCEGSKIQYRLSCK